jgi:toxin CptA
VASIGPLFIYCGPSSVEDSSGLPFDSRPPRKSGRCRVLKLKLQRSRILAVILVIAHGAAIAGIAFAGIPLWGVPVVAVILIVHLAFCIRRDVLLMTPCAVLGIEVGPDNVVNVETRSGGWNEYEVLGSTYVMPHLTVMQLQRADGGAIKRVVLLPDSLPAEDFRRLRVRLRWQEKGAGNA